MALLGTSGPPTNPVKVQGCLARPGKQELRTLVSCPPASPGIRAMRFGSLDPGSGSPGGCAALHLRSGPRRTALGMSGLRQVFTSAASSGSRTMSPAPETSSTPSAWNCDTAKVRIHLAGRASGTTTTGPSWSCGVQYQHRSRWLPTPRPACALSALCPLTQHTGSMALLVTHGGGKAHRPSNRALSVRASAQTSLASWPLARNTRSSGKLIIRHFTGLSTCSAGSPAGHRSALAALPAGPEVTSPLLKRHGRTVGF